MKKIATIVKWTSLWFMSYILYRTGATAAYLERGYEAMGGEMLIMLLPILWWCFEGSIRDWKAVMEDEGCF